MRTLFSILIILSLSFVISACDDSEDDSPDYDTLCERSCEVDETCNLLDGATVEQCLIDCKEQAVNQLDSFFEAFVSCKEEHTCLELQEGGENTLICYEENGDECTTDTTAYLDASCLKRLECDGITDPTQTEIDECKENLHADGNIIRCFQPSTLNETIACIEDADSCSPDPVKICVEDFLGLTLGNSSTNNQQQ